MDERFYRRYSVYICVSVEYTHSNDVVLSPAFYVKAVILLERRMTIIREKQWLCFPAAFSAASFPFIEKKKSLQIHEKKYILTYLQWKMSILKEAIISRMPGWLCPSSRGMKSPWKEYENMLRPSQSQDVKPIEHLSKILEQHVLFTTSFKTLTEDISLLKNGVLLSNTVPETCRTCAKVH